MGGANSASRKDPGNRIPWLPIEAHLQIYQDWKGYDHMLKSLNELKGFNVYRKPSDIIIEYCFGNFTSA